ncbi:hypothetical protein CRE_30511 [Caenorhabditis remanei]|uniref:Sdz-33 F-box domain-containing protein n=1 Tax=Caenorhabditis remanei TaxID=31234 RepID=E3NI64_CAERE|nr:hypothetical protein CRE_30511 [Caenorhabditis remanei]
MDPQKPFPTLRLPFLAIEEVFKAMHPFEMQVVYINFSLISNRTKQVTKMMTFHPEYSVALDISKNLQVAIRGTDKIVSNIYEMTSKKVADGVTKEVVGRIELTVFKYSKDPVEEWKQMCVHVLEIFKKHSIENLRVCMDGFVSHNVSIVDFLTTNEISLNECSLFHWDRKINVDEHAAYLLNNLNVTNELNSYLHIKNANFDGRIPKGLKKLHILHSQWVGYERLLKIDSVQVDLIRDRISYNDWNLFFKKWMAMETNLNLESWNFGFESMEDFRELVLYDIPYEVVDEGVKRTLQTSYGSPREINGGVDIRRIDGKTATFCVILTDLGDNSFLFIH